MFERVPTGDIGLIARGLIILLAIVMIGVGVAEYQLGTLTQRPEQERFFYLGRNQEYIYSAYAFGYGLNLGKLYPLGSISVEEANVQLAIANYTITFPTKIRIDGSRLWYWVDMWRRQFIAEAFAAKTTAIEYWNQARPYAESVFQNVRVQIQHATKQFNEYLRENR